MSQPTVIVGDSAPPSVELQSSEEISSVGSSAWDLLILFAVSSYVPLDTWISNPEGPSLVTALGVTILTFAVLAAARYLLVRIGLDPSGVTYGLLAFAGVFLLGGALVANVPGGRLTVIGLALAFGVTIYGLRRLLVVRMLVAGVSIAMVCSPLIVWATEIAGADGGIHFAYEVREVPISDHRDVLIVIADGYANPMVLQEFYGDSNQEFVERLDDLGFVVKEGAVANYSDTVLAVPSLLQMSYLEASAPLTDIDRKELFAILGGKNSLTASLSAAGYRTVYVESGWLGTQCGNEIDVCVRGPMPDETVYDIAHRSVLRDARGFETGLSFSRGARHALDWLRTDLDSYLGNAQSEFIYVHLLAPHPPLFLDERCESHPSVEHSGFSIGRLDMTDQEIEEAKEAYLDQVTCVNSVLSLVAAEAVEADAVVLFAGDHGPDIGGQLWTGGGDNWSTDQIRERFGPFVAMYGRSCDFGQVVSLVDVGSSFLECLGGPEAAPSDPRSFTTRPTSNGDADVIEVAPPIFAGS